ncbi:MAG: hypothetical protein KBA55_12395 [Ruminococcus sp.]|nr:hypothetical protein [Ruminococcus sp.]
MSITGTGTIDDPYVVTTWDELAEKAALGSSSAPVYVKLGNDINALDEYPDGNIPRITLAANVDGDGRTIRNIYSTQTSNALFFITSGSLSNVKLKNIYTYQSEFFTTTHITASRRVAVQDCEISGVCHNYFYSAGDNCAAFQRCSLNITGDSELTESNYPPLFLSCFIRFRSPSARMFLVNSVGSSRYQMLEGSYIEADMPALTNLTRSSGDTDTKDTAVYIDNCVLDIKTNGEFSLGCSSGARARSILRASHAPNVTGVANITAVDETHWLDAEYLSSIGFSIEVEE